MSAKDLTIDLIIRCGFQINDAGGLCDFNCGAAMGIGDRPHCRTGRAIPGYCRVVSRRQHPRSASARIVKCVY